MLHDIGNRFEERNLFLHVALGLLSLSDRLDALLAGHGITPDGPAETTIAPEDPVVDLVLGLLSVSQTVRRTLHSASIAPRTQDRPMPASEDNPHALRRLLA